jgi:hypothetical protein
MSAHSTTTEAEAVQVAQAVAGIGGPVGVTIDGRSATATTGEFVAFKFRLAPAGLATRRQLSACGLRPGGAQPVASLSWRRGRRIAYLYDVTAAVPKRPMTPAKWTALDQAMRARRTCPDCGADAGYVIPTRYGRCVDCQFGPTDENDWDQCDPSHYDSPTESTQGRWAA